MLMWDVTWNTLNEGGVYIRRAQQGNYCYVSTHFTHFLWNVELWRSNVNHQNGTLMWDVGCDMEDTGWGRGVHRTCTARYLQLGMYYPFSTKRWVMKVKGQPSQWNIDVGCNIGRVPPQQKCLRHNMAKKQTPAAELNCTRDICITKLLKLTLGYAHMLHQLVYSFLK